MAKRKTKKRKQKVGQAKRMYQGARSGRLKASAATTSADQELRTSLGQLRDHSRRLCRDDPYAKRIRGLVVDNVIGPGIGMQSQVSTAGGRMINNVNHAIENAWRRWSRADSCHTGGAMAFSDLERAACEQWFEGGDVFIRLHFSAFGSSDIPLALELIESERLADEHEITPQPGEQISMGVGHDPFGRAIAYYVHKHHQNYLFGLPREGPDEILRIPASEVIHIRMVTRWPQSRGVPGLHAVIDRLEQIGGFETAALVAARSGAQNLGFFENQAFPDGMGEKQEDGSGIIDMQEGQWVELPPGLHPIMHDPKYPHEAFDPFIRTSIRGLAAGTGPSYEAVSRDYSQSNYSSSRLAELDSRDYWRILQKWWIRSFRDVLHRVWLQQAVFSAAIPEINRSAYLADQDKYEAVKWKPRGWSWVDPTKEVAAYKEAERAGYITKTDVIAQTAGGMDIEDMIATRRQELDMLAEAGLTTDTTDIQFEPLDDEPEAETEGDEDPRPSPRLVGGSDGK